MLLQEIRGPIDDKQNDYLRRVANAGRHLLSLISDVIDIAKIEAGKAQACIEQIDLGRLIEEAIDQIRGEAQSKGLRLDVDVPENVIIAADRRRLLQCLLNYLSDALKYTLRGGIAVRLSTFEHNAEEWQIAVSDTGIGIAPADQKRLFQQFSRIDYGYRAAHAGDRIRPVFDPQAGHRYSRRESFHGQPTRPGLHFPTSSAQGHEKMKQLLIIEDDDNNIVLIADLLQHTGHLPLKAMTGREGIRMALHDKPDFVLLDIQLPDMDGYEVLNRIRNAPDGQTIPIIAITSYTISGDRERLMAAGCAGYIEKPIDPMQVIRQIEEMVMNVS